MKKLNKNQKNRIALAGLFTLIIFFILLATMLCVFFLMKYLINHGIIYPQESKTVPDQILFLTFLWSVILGSLLSLLLGLIFLRPVNSVIEGMDHLAHGDFKERLKFSGPFGHLSIAAEVTNSFNNMASELGKTEMLRSDFVNNFSHEFKTPLVSISGFADLMLEEEMSELERREYLRIISDESHRLASMATNVLNLTKIENQTILSDVTRFNLSEQIRGCLLLLENRWTEKNLKLEVQFSDYFYSGNRGMLKQVWVNLIDNAVKYTDYEGTITISIFESENELTVKIGNTGKEIPAEALPYIFNKFYQADRSHADRGSGIGLSVVKAIIELHHGSISVESSDGKTEFTVNLPK